eukprot:gene15744-17333_t
MRGDQADFGKGSKHVEEGKQKYFKPEEEGNPTCATSSSDSEECKRANACKWGYEEQCKHGEGYSKAICREEPSWRHFRNIDERADAFWQENDFGYVRSVNNLQHICEPTINQDSSFSCNPQLTFCKGRHIFMDFGWNGRSIFKRWEDKPFNQGQFGGACKFIDGRLINPNIQRGKLITWLHNIDTFQSLPFKPSVKKNCDVTVSKPTIIMDLDFTGNMYHHFCDFFNLYLTLHVNGSFSKDIDIATWDVRYADRLGPFGDTWKAFTRGEVYSLWRKYEGKKVCFEDVVFALLPRMAYGLYYSTPVIPGCYGSGLFHAFSRFVVRNLNITQERKSKGEPLRITLLSRSTQWRRIVNENELLLSIQAHPSVKAKVVDFNRDVPFLEQLKISHNSDIFIGMHGAGLAHALFLPDWALLFEIYNTEDINCYKDLARLRGVSYMTWEDKSKLKDETEVEHPQLTYEKFRNYRFDIKEFERLLGQAISKVKKSIDDDKFLV